MIDLTDNELVCRTAPIYSVLAARVIYADRQTPIQDANLQRCDVTRLMAAHSTLRPCSGQFWPEHLPSRRPASESVDLSPSPSVHGNQPTEHRVPECHLQRVSVDQLSCPVGNLINTQCDATSHAGDGFCCC